MEIVFTDHAVMRMGQRGITREMIDAALKYGRQIYARNSLYFFLGRQAIKRMGKPADKWEGLTLVLDPRSNCLLTCFKNRRWLKKIRHKR